MTSESAFCDVEFPAVSTLLSETEVLDEELFVERYPLHYLIIEAIDEDELAWRNFTTSTVPAVRKGLASAVLGVAPVRKRDQTNPYSWMITIGRTRSNDIVLADASISKLHGWIRQQHDGGALSFTVTDAGSRNGTHVNGRALRGQTGALPLGARLRLGQVEMLFVDGRLLHQALRRVAGSAVHAA